MSKTITRFVPVKLTREEREIRAAQLAETIHKRDFRETEKKTAMKQFAADIEALNDRVAELARAVKNNEETREIDCYEEIDSARRIVHIKRCDTNATVDTRPMTDSERQNHLPFGAN